MKKIVLSLSILVLFFSGAVSTQAASYGSCANQPFYTIFASEEPPTVVNSLLTDLNFQLRNMPDGNYELFVMYEENSRSTNRAIGTFSSSSGSPISFAISKTQHPAAFNTTEANKGSMITKTLVIKNTATGDDCLLWEYDSYNTPVDLRWQCGNFFTKDNCGGDDGGCVPGYRCRQSADSGARCVADSTCPVDSTPPTESPSPVDPRDLPVLFCTQTTQVENQRCACSTGQFVDGKLPRLARNGYYCCGVPYVDACYASEADKNKAIEDARPSPAPPAASPADGGGGGGGGGGGTPDAPSNAVDIFAGPNSETFRRLNPLRASPYVQAFSSPGGIVSRILVFAFPFAGLILFAMIVWGGFEMITSAASSKGTEAGKQRVTAAIVGFMLLFSAYWVFQIVEEIFGVTIL